MLLILCGSISSWIDDNILNSKAFFGRVSWTLNLEPLPLYDCNALLETVGFRGSKYEKFKVVSVTGGVPWYLEQMQGVLSADDNIRRQCFTKGGMLVDDLDAYFMKFLVNAINFIKTLSKLSKTGLLNMRRLLRSQDMEAVGVLGNLVDLTKAGFITRDFTWSLKPGKTVRISQFHLSDNYLRFYLKYRESLFQTSRWG